MAAIRCAPQEHSGGGLKKAQPRTVQVGVNRHSAPCVVQSWKQPSRQWKAAFTGEWIQSTCSSHLMARVAVLAHSNRKWLLRRYLLHPHLSFFGVAWDLWRVVAVWTGLAQVARGCSEARPNGPFNCRLIDSLP